MKAWSDRIPVVVSTDDEEIKALCRRAGATIIDRPPELATSKSEVKYTLRHAFQIMRGWGWSQEVVMLREGNTIVTDTTSFDRALELMRNVDVDSVLAIATDPVSDPVLTVQVDPEGYIASPFLCGTELAGNRQQREAIWRIWFGADCFRPRNFERYNDFGPWWYMGKRVIGMPVSRSVAVHIDCEEDRQFAEYLLSKAL